MRNVKKSIFVLIFAFITIITGSTSGDIPGLMGSLIPTLAAASTLKVDHENSRQTSTPTGIDNLPAGAWDKISTHMRKDQYAFKHDLKTYTAVNHANHFVAGFTKDNVRLSSFNTSETAWYVEFRTVAWGRGTSIHPVPESESTILGNRCEYNRGSVTEWYVNDNRGLEQGWDLASPPPLDKGHDTFEGNLVIEIEVGGNLHPVMDTKTSTVIFSDQAGNDLLKYGGLAAWDSTNRNLPVRLVLKDPENNSSSTEPRLIIEVNDRDAVYPVTIDPIWQEIRKIQASDKQADDRFGHSVSISGDTAIVGAPYEGTGFSWTGVAYVFGRDQGGTDNWGEIKKIQASDRGTEDEMFGWSVSISGDTAIVGAYFRNAVYIFYRDQGGTDNWGEIKKIQDSDHFGYSVSISGNTAIVGAYGEAKGGVNAGVAHIFYKDHGGTDNWGWKTRVKANDPQADDMFGWSVSISGDTAIVGAFLEDTGEENAGAAYIFARDQGGADGWGEIQKIQASDKQAGDQFGNSVSLSGDTAIVGAFREDTGGDDAGAAYIFGRDQGGTDNWGEIKKIQASDKQANDRFGNSVSISGDTAIVGAPYENTGGNFSGAAYIFDRDQGGSDNWGEIQKIQASDKQVGDQFGISVSISGDTAIVGASFEDTGGDLAGAAYIWSAFPSVTVEYTLCPGLNLVSLPLAATGLDTADLLLADICGDGRADVLWEWLYDSCAFRSWTRWDTAPGWPTEVGMPFWVSISSMLSHEECTWEVVGLVPDEICYTIRPGLNLIAIPIYPTTLLKASDLLADIPNCMGVWVWNRQFDCYRTGFSGFFWLSGSREDFDLLPGYAYWIMYAGFFPFEWCPTVP